MNSRTLAPSEIILSVSEITAAIKSHLEPIFQNITIRGEISNLKTQASGHIYFSLIDKNSLIQAVVFRSYVTKAVECLRDGDEIIATGEIVIYSPRGNYQLVIRNVRPQGAGAELIQLQILKKKLASLGWFRLERKKSIPLDWRKVGVITSPTGAVIRDILSVLERRMGNSFHLILYPVRVQGETAASEIALAIREMNKHNTVDLLIVCRGGGSSDDLSPFNSEIVAEACFESVIPLISAVGHETDTTIIDLVADIRAPTPSAAAEIISQRHVDIVERIKSYKKALKNAYAPMRLQEFYAQKLDDIRSEFEAVIKRICTKYAMILTAKQSVIHSLNPKVVLSHHIKRVSEYKTQFQTSIEQKILTRKKELRFVSDSFYATMSRIIHQKKLRFTSLNSESVLPLRVKNIFTNHRKKLEMTRTTILLLNPKLPLEKGYAMIVKDSHIQDKKTEVLNSIQSIKKGDSVTIVFHDGSASSEISEIHAS